MARLPDSITSWAKTIVKETVFLRPGVSPETLRFEILGRYVTKRVFAIPLSMPASCCRSPYEPTEASGRKKPIMKMPIFVTA